jgi:hypothetical protein
MTRWTLTTRDGGKVHGYEPNAILAYKTALSVAEGSNGGGIITVDDLETKNSIFHTEAVAEATARV